MTLPASGAISLAQIQAEFGGPSSNISLESYYRGGAYVSSSSSSTIPTSGAISLENFYGASAIIPLILSTQLTSGGGDTIYGYAGQTYPFSITSTFGSITEATYLSYTITQLFTEFVSTQYVLYLGIEFGNNYPPQNIFSTMSFTANTGVAYSLTSASASYSQILDTQHCGIWHWNMGTTFAFTHGTTYTINFS